MTLAWKLVSKHLRPQARLQAVIRKKLAGLERHLQPFPANAVHLLVALEPQARRGTFEAAITLHLPHNILHSRKTAKGDPVAAFDASLKALLQQMKGLRTRSRATAIGSRGGRCSETSAKPAVRFARTPQPHGPGSLRETLAAMIRRYHGRLLYHVQSQLRRDQEDDKVPRGAIKPEVVVDEVVRIALANPEKKPSALSYRLWLFTLAQRELRRRYRQIRMDGERNVPIEEEAYVADDQELVEGYDAEKPMEILEAKLEPPVVTRGDLLRDEHAFPPDAIAAEHDLIDYLHRITANWPEKERAVFDLHFLEGFDPHEVALLENLKPKAAQETIATVQDRLRGILTGATERWAQTRAASSVASRSATA